jgi:hypothetical protein
MGEFLRLFTRAHKLLRAATDDNLSQYGCGSGRTSCAGWRSG